MCERIFGRTKKIVFTIVIMSENYEVVVIGGGPGGYVCAIRCAQLGIKTACIESRGSLGGTCLNVGCIPSKSLLNLSDNFAKAKNNFSNAGIETGRITLNLLKMMKAKEKSVTMLTKGVEFLFKKNKVTYIKGKASLKSNNEIIVKTDTTNKVYTAKKIVISTGSVTTNLPGIKIDEQKIVSSTGALSLNKVPKKMVVIGGGYIGLEMGSVWSRLGSEVLVVEYLDHIIPGMDMEISKEFYKILQKQGIKFLLETKVEEVRKKNNQLTLSLSTKNGKKNELECDIVLVAVGRRANTEGLKLETNGIKLGKTYPFPIVDLKLSREKALSA